MEFNKLPIEVLNNIISYKLGTPEYMKLKNNTQLKKIQKQFKIEYEKPVIFDYDPDKIEMCYSITGSRLNPTILEKQENTISNFIETFIYKNYDGERWFNVDIEITFDYCKTVKTTGIFHQYEVSRGHHSFRKLPRILRNLVSFDLEQSIKRFNREIEKHKRWQKEDTEVRQFKTENFRINIEIRKVYDADTD